MRHGEQASQSNFDEMLRSHRIDIYRLVRPFVSGAEEAVDLTQEIFLRAFLHREEFRSDSAFSTWLYRIALNLCHDEDRRTASRKAREILTAETLALGDTAPAPLEALLVRERGEQLQHLIDSLPPEEYVAVILHYYNGLPQQQVAEVLDLSLSAVESRLRRAVGRLRSGLKRESAPMRPPVRQGEQHLTLGRILLQLRDYQAALPYCEKAVTSMPESVDALCALATAYWREENLDGAWEMAQRALRVDPACGEALNLSGILHGLKGRREEAVSCFRKAAHDERWHTRERAYHNLGINCIYMGRWSEASAPLEKALALNPRYAIAYTHLGNVYLYQKRYDEALHCQDVATQLDPRYFQAHFNRGETLEEMGQLEEAIESYRRSSDLAPWWIDAHAALGLLLHQQGRTEEAEAQFTTALSIEGGGGHGSYFKGRLHLVKGDIDKALSSFLQAADESLEWAEPLLDAARIYERRGDLATAARLVREAVKREPENEEAKERIRGLRKKMRRGGKSIERSIGCHSLAAPDERT